MDCSLENMDAFTLHMGHSFGMKHSGWQIFVPHMHVDGFVEVPAPFAHASPVQQAHESTVVHGPVFNAECKKSCEPAELAGSK